MVMRASPCSGRLVAEQIRKLWLLSLPCPDAVWKSTRGGSEEPTGACHRHFLLLAGVGMRGHRQRDEDQNRGGGG